jgi:hypothetical protein
VAAVFVACTATSVPASQATPTTREVDLVWASYQMNDEPHYRLIFEGGSDGARPSEVRIVMPPGATVASAPTVPSASEPLRLCGPTKTSEPRLYGPLRATLAMPEQQFKDFIRQPADFRVEAKIGDAWRPTRLTLLCHVQQ